MGDLKKLIAAQTGTNAQKIVLKKWYTAFKDHVQLQDYEINDGMVSKGCEAEWRWVGVSVSRACLLAGCIQSYQLSNVVLS